MTRLKNDFELFSSPESAFYEYQTKMEKQNCQVCNNQAAGFHHGAYVCEACKKFFKRYTQNVIERNNSMICESDCDLNKIGRRKCSDCRYRKCLEVGMFISDIQVKCKNNIDISKIPCRVCSGKSSGFHFGSLTCEGCKGFFRRAGLMKERLVCIGGSNNCPISHTTRVICKLCRYQRCLSIGMSKISSRIGRQSNAVKFQCAKEISRQTNVGSSNISQIESTTTQHPPTITSYPTSSITSSSSSSSSSLSCSDMPTIYHKQVHKHRYNHMSSDLAKYHNNILEAMRVLQISLKEAEGLLQLKPRANISSESTLYEVWNDMMHHFDIHSHILVTFAKQIIPFNQLPLISRRQLIRHSMYPIILLNSTLKFTNVSSEITDTVHYNYFDFLPFEYDVILRHFPSIQPLKSHVERLSDLIYSLELSPYQLGILCVIQLFRYKFDEIESNNLVREVHGTSIRLLWISILDQLIYTSPLTNSDSKMNGFDWTHCLNQLECPNDLICALSNTLHTNLTTLNQCSCWCDKLNTLFVQIFAMLDTYNQEHMSIIENLKCKQPQLSYSVLYTEVFSTV